MPNTVSWSVAAVLAGGYLLPKAYRRWQLSRAKHRSLAGHSRWSKRLARLLPFYEYDAAHYFCADGAPANVAAQRSAAFEQLAALYATRYAKSAAATAEIYPFIPDMHFTSRYRVPYQFRERVRSSFKGGSMLQASRGVQVCDLDGNWFYDLTGSYGVNVLGYDFYKDCMDRGAALVRDLGPVLGAYHPIMGYILRRLREVSGHEQASFHMSGTEAVMQAVRLALYHTRRRRIVRFCGAYHGWWGDVQPGVGNPQNPPDTLTLADMSEKALTVLRTRKDIACVLINPLQALHPNANAPGDSGLIDGVRSAQFNREAYTCWLQQLRQVCTERGIVLIFDEVFLGFRLAMGGAQEYFGVQADLVTYGKTLGGGYPVGVVCGPADLMKRYRDQRPADITFARGTFKEHPYVMGAMHEFLRFLESDEARVIYDGVDERWNQRAVQLNQRLQAAELPLRVANMSSVWTVIYTQPGRYNWMLQYYLRAEGLALSWVGTGRFIFSLNYSDADFAAVADRVLLAAEAMRRDGWWWSEPSLTRKSIKQRILGETRRAWFGQRTG